ncbi:CBS domain-containing protein [Palleronia sp. LCG004]|uniref:CBS domain-containing protein n=1 Tax=Palleronia sp. LCG004 TaxID=3079304 RepID=UPI002942DEE0|nr:CBS domain-containing protein [Palleronia sp. LCG004]WOI55220.1 CBS domain-containing protein [Palleronia sp. LCG004]
MKVEQILSSKPQPGVETIAPEASVADAVAVLSEKRIGALVVSRDGQRADGILSERDIVRELGRKGAECLDARVEDLMTRKVETCVGQDNTEEILTRMTEGRFRHMPVVEDERLVGLISTGDVVKARLSELRMERDALEGMVMGY